MALSDSFLLLAWQWMILAAIAAGSGLYHRRVRFIGVSFLFLSCLGIGGARMQAVRADLASRPLIRFHDPARPVELVGVISAPPEMRERSTLLLLRVETVAVERGEASRLFGDVAILAPSAGPWQYGDRIRASGVLSAPSAAGRLSAESLARVGVMSWMPRPSGVQRLQVRQGPFVFQSLFALRARAELVVRQLYPDPEAALLAGILLGEETRIPEAMRRDFAATGTSHIVAISGFNLALLSGALFAVTGRWLGSRRGALVSGLTILGYTVLVGAAPPVSRAAVTALLALAARQLGRTTDGLASLSMSAVVLTALNPLLVYDVGFQLSFAATLGLVLYSQRLSNWFAGWVRRVSSAGGEKRITELAGDLVWSGVAAQATALPITVSAFRKLPWISLLVNPLVLPVQPALMGLGGISVLLGSIWEPLGRPAAWLAWVPLTFTHHAVRWFASLPTGSLAVLDPHPVWGLAYATILLALTGTTPPIVKQITNKLSLPRPPLALAWLIGVLFIGIVWKGVHSAPDGKLHVRLLDTVAESLLIESPTGRFVLIGGGSSPVPLAEALGERLPVFYPHLDWVVLRSTDSQDTDGLLSLARDVEVGAVLLLAGPGGPAYRAFLQDNAEAARPALTALPGQSLDLGGGAYLVVLATGETAGAVKIQFGRFVLAIVPAGIAADPSLPFPRAVTAAVLPHAGDLVDNSSERLKELDPRLVLLSVEAGNREGFPPVEVLEWLQGRTVLRTDNNGWIELVSDGETLSIWTER